MKQYKVKLKNGVIPIPDELMKELGWSIGDEVVFEETQMWEEHGEFRGLTIGLAKELDSKGEN